MLIGIDIMGGDFAPEETLQGAILAATEIADDYKICLFGNEAIISEFLKKKEIQGGGFEIVHCEQSIEMGDDPVKAFMTKKDSSITKGFFLLKNGIIDGFASAGNTGAMLVGASTVIGVIPGILRPTIASVYPSLQGGGNLVLDVGINAEVKPEILYQFGIIGSIYMEKVYGRKNPKVGLLNIGEEESKGNSVVKAAYQLMKNSKDFNFIGNVEGNTLNDSDIVDVVVSDGFSGNIVLKQAETFYEIIKHRNIKDAYFDNFNYENYGGTPILGVNKTVVVGHGISSRIAIKNMILHTAEMCKSDFANCLTKAL